MARFGIARTFTIAGLGYAANCACLGCSDDCRNLGNTRVACGAHLSRTPFIGVDGSFAVAGRVNGRNAQLLIDTGSSASVISSKFLAVADKSALQLDELCLGDFCVRSEIVDAWETPSSSIENHMPQGFVGMDLLSALTLRFEYGQFLTVGDGADSCSGREIGFDLTDAGTPVTDVSVDEIDLGKVTLDSGATRTVFDQATADLLGSYFMEQATLTSSCTVYGCTDNSAKLSRAKRVCVSDICAENLEVKFPIWNGVGANWLAEHNVRFDFQRRMLVFCDL